jgi:hypothetical protein
MNNVFWRQDCIAVDCLAFQRGGSVWNCTSYKSRTLNHTPFYIQAGALSSVVLLRQPSSILPGKEIPFKTFLGHVNKEKAEVGYAGQFRRLRHRVPLQRRVYAHHFHPRQFISS